MIESRVWQPALLQMTADGVVTNVIEYPKEFQITGDGKTGLRDNQGFEGLAAMPSGRLIAGLEQPLIQDGAVTFDRGARTRRCCGSGSRRQSLLPRRVRATRRRSHRRRVRVRDHLGLESAVLRLMSALFTNAAALR